MGKAIEIKQKKKLEIFKLFFFFFIKTPFYSQFHCNSIVYNYCIFAAYSAILYKINNKQYRVYKSNIRKLDFFSREGDLVEIKYLSLCFSSEVNKHIKIKTRDNKKKNLKTK